MPISNQEELIKKIKSVNNTDWKDHLNEIIEVIKQNPQFQESALETGKSELDFAKRQLERNEKSRRPDDTVKFRLEQKIDFCNGLCKELNNLSEKKSHSESTSKLADNPFRSMMNAKLESEKLRRKKDEELSDLYKKSASEGQDTLSGGKKIP